MSVFLDLNFGFTLEDLDIFGSLDELLYSLDDHIWESDNYRIRGRTVSPTSARAKGAVIFFGGPTRSVSPTGTFVRQDWVMGPGRTISVSPGSTRFNMPILAPGPLKSVSPGTAQDQAYMGVTPLELPVRSMSSGSARVTPRFRGHDWVTRAV